MDSFVGLGFWMLMVLLGSFDVLGLVEGGKSIATSVSKRDWNWLATTANFVLSYAVAYFLGVLPGAPIFGSLLSTVAFGGTTMFSFGEVIGYNVIVKWLFALTDAGVGFLEKKLEAEKK